MEFWQGLLLITGVHLLAAMSPGPDFVLISKQALTKGRRVGLWCSLGITLGLGVHVVYSVLGLATVVAHSQWLLTAIKIIGGCYLLYLGLQGMRSKSKQITSQLSTQSNQLAVQSLNIAYFKQANMAYIKQGFLCNVFNPKTPVYFVAIFTLVLSPAMPVWQLAVYGAWMMLLQFVWFAVVTFLLSTPSINNRFQKVSHWVDRVMGAAMAGLGLNLLLKR